MPRCCSPRWRRSSGAQSAAPWTRAPSSISRRPFTFSVEPVETRSTMMSATPRCGAISAAPETGTIVTVRPRLRRTRAVSRGNTVATRAPSWTSASCAMPLSSLAATREPAAPEAEVQQDAPRPRRDSSTRSRPVMPRSAAPSATNSGMSSRAHEEREEVVRPSDACSARSAHVELEARALQQLARALGQPALVGQCDTDHGAIVPVCKQKAARQYTDGPRFDRRPSASASTLTRHPRDPSGRDDGHDAGSGSA